VTFFLGWSVFILFVEIYSTKTKSETFLILVEVKVCRRFFEVFVFLPYRIKKIPGAVFLNSFWSLTDQMSALYSKSRHIQQTIFNYIFIHNLHCHLSHSQFNIPPVPILISIFSTQRHLQSILPTTNTKHLQTETKCKLSNGDKKKTIFGN
jgi:hypothetical protein